MVTMRCRRTGLAAACHALLPVCRQDCSCPPETCLHKYRFVTCILPDMLQRFVKKGVFPEDLEIKMFGGADMIMVRKNSRAWENQRVGRKNILAARNVARNLNIRFSREDVGGTLGRKIYFDTESGEVWLKRLSKPVPNAGLG